MSTCSLHSILDTKSFCFHFAATLLTLSVLTSVTCCFGCATSFIGTSFLLIIASWTIARWIKKTYFHEKISPLNKAVLVTGCDSGFGHRLANKLNENGYTVYAACLDPSGAGPQELLKKATFPKATKLVAMNVTSDDDVTRVVQEVKTTLGKDGQKLWAIVNNAGLFNCAQVEWGKLADYQKIIDVNVIGVARVTRAFLPLLRKSKGRVVNVASIAGRISGPGMAIYSISKHAVVAFSTALRREMFPWGVKVSTIEPAIYKTPMADLETLKNGVMKSWSESPEDVKEEYGPEYFDAFLKHMIDYSHKKARNNPEEVVDAMLDAITAVEPEIRYKVCGVDYHILWLLSDYLPFSVADFLYKFRLPTTKPKAA